MSTSTTSTQWYLKKKRKEKKSKFLNESWDLYVVFLTYVKSHCIRNMIRYKKMLTFNWLHNSPEEVNFQIFRLRSWRGLIFEEPSVLSFHVSHSLLLWDFIGRVPFPSLFPFYIPSVNRNKASRGILLVKFNYILQEACLLESQMMVSRYKNSKPI